MSLVQLLKDKNLPSFTSVAVQTLPLVSEAPHSLLCSPLTPTRTIPSPTEARNDIEDLEVRIDLLASAINNFTKERQTTRGALESRRIPIDIRSDPLPGSPPSSFDRSRASPIPHSPPEYQLPPELPPEPPSRQPPLNKVLPDFQHTLRVEQECLR